MGREGRGAERLINNELWEGRGQREERPGGGAPPYYFSLPLTDTLLLTLTLSPYLSAFPPSAGAS